MHFAGFKPLEKARMARREALFYQIKKIKLRHQRNGFGQHANPTHTQHQQVIVKQNCFWKTAPREMLHVHDMTPINSHAEGKESAEASTGLEKQRRTLRFEGTQLVVLSNARNAKRFQNKSSASLERSSLFPPSSKLSLSVLLSLRVRNVCLLVMHPRLSKSNSF